MRYGAINGLPKLQPAAPTICISFTNAACKHALPLQHQPIETDSVGIYRHKRNGVIPTLQLNRNRRRPFAGPVDEDIYGSTLIDFHCNMFTR